MKIFLKLILLAGGGAYYHADAVANILSFSQLRENGHSITFNPGPDNADAFTVTTTP